MGYVVLHCDGTLSFWINKPEKEAFGMEIKCFAVKGTVTVSEIIDWVANNYSHFQFKEIKLGE